MNKNFPYQATHPNLDNKVTLAFIQAGIIQRLSFKQTIKISCAELISTVDRRDLGARLT